jgi:phosphoinositide-3-kinase regulatory subunit 4
MIALDPAARPTFETLLHRTRGTIFPEVFYSFLHGYVSSVNELPTRSPFAPAPPAVITPTVSNQSTTSTATAKAATAPMLQSVDAHYGASLPSDADARMERIWADHESVESYLAEVAGEEIVMDVRVEYGPAETPSKPFEVGRASPVG